MTGIHTCAGSLAPMLYLGLVGLCLGLSGLPARADGTAPNLDRFLAKLDAGQQVTVVALGDSNTELTFHTRGSLNWVGLLQVALFDKYGNDKVMMINAGKSGDGTAAGLARLDRDVLRFEPDLVIICFWDGDMDSLREIIRRVRASGKADVLLRTSNPIVAVNMPPVTPPVEAAKEWPGTDKGEVAKRIVALAAELQLPVVDHYTAWVTADGTHQGPGVSNPNKLWCRMSDAFHPGPLGHLAFYRELAPMFKLPEKLPWEF
jgi:lysophospholipase L1-like esterase